MFNPSSFGTAIWDCVIKRKKMFSFLPYTKQFCYYWIRNTRYHITKNNLYLYFTYFFWILLTIIFINNNHFNGCFDKNFVLFLFVHFYSQGVDILLHIKPEYNFLKAWADCLVEIMLRRTRWISDRTSDQKLFLEEIRASVVCVALKTIWRYFTLMNVKLRYKHMSITVTNNLSSFKEDLVVFSSFLLRFSDML